MPATSVEYRTARFGAIPIPEWEYDKLKAASDELAHACWPLNRRKAELGWVQCKGTPVSRVAQPDAR